MKKIVFSCDTTNKNIDFPLVHNFVNSMIEFQITSNCKKDESLFHDKTFVIPYSKPYDSHASNEDQTIVRFFDKSRNEILGSFKTVYLDSTFIDSSYFIPTIIDTSTYKINNKSVITIKQRLLMSYFKDSYWITLNKNECNQIEFIKLCISKGKKSKNKLYGISCSEFIKVVRNNL